MARNILYFSERRKQFITYLLLFAAPLVAVYILVYVIMLNNIHQSTGKAYNNLLSNVMQSMEVKISDLDHFSLQLSNTSWVRKIAYMQGAQLDADRVDALMLKEYAQQFANYKTINNFLGEIAIYFEAKDLVISSLGEDSLQSFANNIFRTEDLDLISVVKSDANMVFSPLNLSTYGNRKTGFFYLHKVPIYGLKDNVSVLFFIKEQSFGEIIAPLLTSASGQASVTDQSGKLLYAAAAPERSDAHANRSSFESVSQVSGWKYEVIVPDQVFTPEVNSLRWTILIIIVVSVLIGWLLSLRLAIRGYKPLANLISFIQAKSGEEPPIKAINEFDWLQNKLQAVFEQEEQVAAKLRQQMPMIKDAYLKRILEGGLEQSQQLFKALELLDLTFPGPRYCSCILHGCESESLAAARIKDLAASRGVTVNVFEYAEQTVALCNYEDLSDFFSFVHEMPAIASACEVENFTVAVGSEGQDLHTFSTSYEQARTVMAYRFYKRSESVLLFDNKERGMQAYFYPYELEYKMTNYLKSGDYKGAIELFLDIWRANMDQSLLSPSVFQDFLLHLESTVVKIVHEKALQGSLNIEPRAVLQLKNEEEAEEYISGLYRKVCDRIIQMQEHKEDEFIGKIMTFIHDHLTDPELSLSLVADRHYLSSSYLSRYFKEQKGMNFLEYLNRSRLELAKRLLADGSTDIKQVSKRVGYDSDVTFRRLFKKYEGITPSRFREMT